MNSSLVFSHQNGFAVLPLLATLFGHLRGRVGFDWCDAVVLAIRPFVFGFTGRDLRMYFVVALSLAVTVLGSVPRHHAAVYP